MTVTAWQRHHLLIPQLQRVVCMQVMHEPWNGHAVYDCIGETQFTMSIIDLSHAEGWLLPTAVSSQAHMQSPQVWWSPQRMITQCTHSTQPPSRQCYSVGMPSIPCICRRHQPSGHLTQTQARHIQPGPDILDFSDLGRHLSRQVLLLNWEKGFLPHDAVWRCGETNHAHSCTPDPDPTVQEGRRPDLPLFGS